MAAGVVVIMVAIMGTLFFAYFKLDDKISGISTELTRTQTKVDQLIQRPVPPAPTVLPGLR